MLGIQIALETPNLSGVRIFREVHGLAGLLFTVFLEMRKLFYFAPCGDEIMKCPSSAFRKKKGAPWSSTAETRI